MTIYVTDLGDRPIKIYIYFFHPKKSDRPW